MFCPRCSHKHKIGREKCGNCGTDLTPQLTDLTACFTVDDPVDREIKVCPKCVIDWHASLDYCTKCGTKLLSAYLDENEEYVIVD